MKYRRWRNSIPILYRYPADRNNVLDVSKCMMDICLMKRRPLPAPKGKAKPITLTGAVARFFEAERAEDFEALARCFDERATVRDEGRVIQGSDAVKRWMKDAKAK